MAPEQIRGTPAVSHKTDLYALGVVLYQLLTGQAPFEGSSPVVLMHCHLNEPPPRPSAKVHEIPQALDDLVVNLMAKTPADRPWDAAAVGVKLTELRDKADRGESIAMVWPAQGPAAGRASSRPPPTARWRATPPARPRKKKARKTRTMAGISGRDRTEIDGASGWLNRSTIQTGLLVAALLAIGGFIAYSVWPPSAAYLFGQAEKLMASSRRV